MKTRFLTPIGVALTSAVMIIATHDILAQSVPAIQVTNVDAVPVNDSFTFGYEFTPNVNLTVTDLGMYDSTPADNLPGTFDIAIWDISQPTTPLVQEVVLADAPLTDSFRYISLMTPLELSAGIHYRIGASATSGTADWIRTCTYDGSTWLTVTNEKMYASGAALAMPDTTHPSVRQYISANMLVVPQPATLLLATVGMGRLLLIGRRRR